MSANTAASTAEFKAGLFRKDDVSSLPSLACRRRYLDAMLVSRELKAGASDFSKRVAEDDKRRLVRDAFGKLKMCVLAGGEFDADAKEATAKLPNLGPFLYTLKH